MSDNLANKDFQEIIRKIRKGEHVDGYRANKIKKRGPKHVSKKQQDALKRDNG